MQKSVIFKILYVIFVILLILTASFLSLLGYIGNNYNYEKFDLAINEPTTLVQSPKDSSTLYVSEKSGRILKFTNDKDTSSSDTFLDLSNVTLVTNEDGFLGMAFHPQYPEVNKFFTFHSELRGCEEITCIKTILSVFNVSDGEAVRASQVEMIVISQDELYHRGGTINFGPDGYLYVHIGDGSFQDRAQNTTNFFGSILRIDVDNPINSSIPYGIPADNPFVSNPNVRDEIYAFGMRNPFRGDFDRTTGDYWFGDVGNALREEVNKLEAGGNYEWPFYEGNLCRICTNDTRWNQPLLDYPHPETGNEELGIQFEFQNLDDPYGIAIVGTTIYRGSELPDLVGKLIMTDYLGLIFKVDTVDASTEFILRLPNIISAVWQDVDTNELYFVALGVDGGVSGGIYVINESFPIYLFSAIAIISLMILIPLMVKYNVFGKSELPNK